jgi:adenine-specific DNA-methyltransferase
MHDSQAKFQQLLRELFQFDSADLDFGIYRIMNHKRDVIERFITVELPQEIAAALDQGALAEQTQLQQELAETMRQIRETLGDAALDADGRLATAYHAIPLGKKYLELQAKAASARSHDAQEAAVYNHLYTFFSRYYQEGDFISKRRYSKHARYAIPYNGEEVMLYWANHDQYYVKSGEYFPDYSYRAPNGVTVHFKLQAADVEQNNVKGDKRFFLPQPAASAWDAAAGVLVIPCVYRPLTPAEVTRYGKNNPQEAIIAQTVAAMPAQVSHDARALAALTATRRTDAKGNPITYLEHHLRQYTRRNTSDFFIHKDLAGFLGRELDFYLKHEVLNLEELERAGEALAPGWFALLRLIKRVGARIIAFLAQIEEFQKRLWEKRKFVTASFYCVRVGVIAEDFYAEIAANDAQWQTWQRLVALADPGTPAQRTRLLQSHPSLMLDTRHFAPDFVDRLLATFADLDGWTDGLLVHSEKWQALNLLGERYREQVKCVYIDPPYNTGQSEIIYKNYYKHSSWLSLIGSRLIIGRMLLSSDGMQCTTIDDTEFHRLREIIAQVFGEENISGVVVIKNNPSGRSTVKGFSIAHEYAVFSSGSADVTLGMIPRTKQQLSQYPEEDELGRFQWRSFLRAGGANDFRVARPRLHYPLIVAGDKIRLPKMEWSEQIRRWTVVETPRNDEEILWPVVNGTEYTWRLGTESLVERLIDLRARRMRDGRIALEVKFRLDEAGVLSKTVWDEKEMNATAYGTTFLRHIMGESQAFSFPKSVYAVEKSIRVCSTSASCLILDYFAGSGTTGHAVINLNREDGGRRRFILVEMGAYFDTVLLPRLLKVAYTPAWKEGKPQRPATAEEVARGPRLIKVLRLESYEDALNNIEFAAAAQPALHFDDYLLQYMLAWETRDSATLLNVTQLDRPFAYTLRLHRDGATREQPVDLPETFAYLLGLTVHTRKSYADGGRRYLVHRGVLRNGRRVAVLWRDVAGWSEADYLRERDFVAAQQLAAGVDELFVNGDSLIPGAQALEGVFKARMFAPVEV